MEVILEGGVRQELMGERKWPAAHEEHTGQIVAVVGD
jgi:hypothetical protein